jgi:hypothetical protein
MQKQDAIQTDGAARQRWSTGELLTGLPVNILFLY